VRGTFSYGQQPTFFQLELRLLKRLQEEGYTNLQLLLPFVRTVEEVQFCLQLVQQIGLSDTDMFQLWMMAEVPSVLFLLPQYVEAGIQGIAIGTNDLTQLLLGIDRDQALFSNHFDARHPAVQAAIAQLVQQAQALRLPSILCGSLPVAHTDFLTTLSEQGLTGISVDAGAIEAISRVLQRVTARHSSPRS